MEMARRKTHRHPVVWWDEFKKASEKLLQSMVQEYALTMGEEEALSMRRSIRKHAIKPVQPARLRPVQNVLTWRFEKLFDEKATPGCMSLIRRDDKPSSVAIRGEGGFRGEIWNVIEEKRDFLIPILAKLDWGYVRFHENVHFYMDGEEASFAIPLGTMLVRMDKRDSTTRPPGPNLVFSFNVAGVTNNNIRISDEALNAEGLDVLIYRFARRHDTYLFITAIDVEPVLLANMGWFRKIAQRLHLSIGTALDKSHFLDDPEETPSPSRSPIIETSVGSEAFNVL